MSSFVTAGGDHGVVVLIDLCVDVHVSGVMSLQNATVVLWSYRKYDKFAARRLSPILETLSWKYAEIFYDYSVPVSTTAIAYGVYDTFRILTH